MAIFGFLETENIVQVNDRTRLFAGKSFVSKDIGPITDVWIEPETGAGFVKVSGAGLNTKDWYVDWQYSTAGTKTVSLKIDVLLPVPDTVTVTKQIEVLTEADDMLWSNDQLLAEHEPDILKYVTSGRNTYLNIHRSVQSKILDWLDGLRVYNVDGKKLTKADLNLTDDLKQLATYWALELIESGISNRPDDMFAMKARDYRKLVLDLKAKGRIQADLNGDAQITSADAVDMKSFIMVRR